jgi:uncharacterized protein (TIGR02597 family)
VTIDVLAGSQTYISVPLVPAPTLSTALASDPIINGVSDANLSFADAGFENNSLSGNHFIRFTSGNREGRWYPITANTSSSLTIDLNGDDLSGVAAADAFQVKEFWTLANLLPVGNSAIHESAGNLGFQRETEVLLPDQISEGKNLSPTRIFFLKSTGWVAAVSGFPVADDVVIAPDSFIIVQHPADKPDTQLVVSGSVDIEPFTVQINTNATTQQDNYVSVSRPVSMSLGQLSLIGSGAFTASTGNLGFQRADELYLYDNTQVSEKKSPSRVFFVVGSEWREAVSGFPNVTDDIIIQPGDAFFIRKKATADGATAFWKNIPTY